MKHFLRKKNISSIILNTNFLDARRFEFKQRILNQIKLKLKSNLNAGHKFNFIWPKRLNLRHKIFYERALRSLKKYFMLVKSTISRQGR